MRVTVLASGSGGNSILLEAEGTRVLIDAGLSARQLATRMESLPIRSRLDDVQAIFVTHEHTDHTSGVPALASAGIAVYATEGTARAARLGGARPLGAGARIRVGALEVLPVALPHDGAEPVGFVVEDGRSRAGVLTDCGHPRADVAGAFAGCDVLVLETNHDAEMLRTGNYPAMLKRRIGGENGHLSNDQAADLLRMMSRPAPQVLILAHLSQVNNRPRLARLAIERAFAPLGRMPSILVASQAHPTSPVTCDGGRVDIARAEDNRQLRLAFPNG